MSIAAPTEPSHQFLQVGKHFEQQHEGQNNRHIEPGQRRLLEAEIQKRRFEEREELAPMQRYDYDKAHQLQHFRETVDVLLEGPQLACPACIADIPDGRRFVK
jgi:hypothetical protein